MEQPPSNVQDGSSPTQQASQLYDASATQASRPVGVAATSNSPPAEPENDNAWMSEMVQSLLHTEIKTALDSVLLPRTKEIEQEVATMQQEVSSVDNKSKEEQAEVEEDLARMAKLVFTFQSHISQLLPNGVSVSNSSDPATPE